MRAALLIACIIGLAVAPQLAHPPARGLCARWAAASDDPDKPKNMPGVATIAPSDIAIALKYCKVASGSSRRAMYELGRPYAANKQIPEAVAAWRKAADKGSTAAMVELGAL